MSPVSDLHSAIWNMPSASGSETTNKQRTEMALDKLPPGLISPDGIRRKSVSDWVRDEQNKSYLDGPKPKAPALQGLPTSQQLIQSIAAREQARREGQAAEAARKAAE